MLKIRLALLGVLALFIAGGIATSTASASGPFWHVNGSKLIQERKQIKLQLKGIAVLTSKIAGFPAKITCQAGKSEGASIEGSGAQKPGQDKGQILFSQCEVKPSFKGCLLEEPIKTNQTKSKLVTFSRAGQQTKYADLFEPQQGTTFAIIKFIKNGEECSLKPTELPVTGTVAAEIIPKEQEVQEGLLVFPGEALTQVLVENEQTNQQEAKTIGLHLGAEPATFSSVFGVRLDAGGTFGVFST